jgi:hypothetical protein
VGKVIWFALGVGLTVVVVMKGRELMRRATPEGIQRQVQQQAQGLAGKVSDFVETMTTSMAEREAELRSELGMEEPTEA